MKQCKKITGWTDYPFIELGDISGVKAPIRRIKVLSYDQDKYAVVQTLEGLTKEIKAGYLYRNQARLGKGAKIIKRRKLERMIPFRETIDQAMTRLETGEKNDE